MAPKKAAHDHFKKAHRRYYLRNLPEDQREHYTHRHQALYDDHYATDWAALDDELKGAYSTLRAKDYGLEEDPPIAANDFKKPDFIRRALGLPEESDEEEVSDDGSNEVVPGGDGESSEEEINGGLGEEENVEEPSDNGVNIESPNENEGLEDSVERTPSGEELASDIDGSLKEDEASEDNDDEKSPIIFYDRDEPDNGFRDEQLLPLAIALPGATGKKAPRMSLKEFEALGFDEYPPNEWDCRLEDSKEFSTLKWYPKARLGQGACGRATLWVEVDTLNQKVFDTVIAKDVNFEKEWDSKSAWWDIDHEIPMEVAAHRTVCSHNLSPKKTVPVFILPYMGFHVHKALRSFRLFTEHAPYGDLFDFMQKFPLPNPLEKEKDKDKSSIQQDMIPVGFAWRVFLVLVKAAIRIHAYGIIHRDLKPENILLIDNAFVHVDGEGTETEVAETKEMKGWNLKPVIGDFGSARPVEREGFSNPDDFDMKGHPPYFAPEELRTEPAMFNPAKKIDEKTTVFHLGCCMHQFLHGGKLPRVQAKKPGELLNPPEPVWRHHDPNPESESEGAKPDDDNASPDTDEIRLLGWIFDEEIDRSELDWGAYNRHFKYGETHDGTEDGSSFEDLIAACLRFDPKYRPSLKTLMAWVQDAVNDLPDAPTDEDYDLVHSKKRKRQPGEEKDELYDHEDTLRLEKLRKVETEKGL